MNGPVEIQELLIHTFFDGKAYGQFATVDNQRVPSVRTVHFLSNKNVGHIYVSSHTLSEKWSNIKNGSHKVSGCFWDQEQRIQFRFFADATLIDADTDATFVQSMWGKMREGVRTAYLLGDKEIPMYKKEISINTSEHSSHHGVIDCQPYCWDIFYENTEEYRFGRRQIFKLNAQNQWTKKDVSSLHERDILLYDNHS